MSGGRRIYLIRHPQPAVDAGVCYGRSDLGLAEDAQACAGGLRPLLPEHTPIYASPLSRCRHLAEQLHAAPRYDPRLMEMNFGEWEMQPWAGIGRDAIDAWLADPLDYAPPGGESVGAMRARVAEFLGEHAAEPCIALVVHAGVMKVCLAELLGLPQQEWFAYRFEFGSATLIEADIDASRAPWRLAWANRRQD